MPRIEIARQAGACYGVERALKMARQASEDAAQPVHTLGPLIHNPLVVSELERAGVRPADTPEEAGEGTLVIRAHGVTPKVISRAQDLGLAVIDATCPYVKRVHHAAERLAKAGYQVIVVGESGHPEVQGILGHAGEGAHVVSTVEDLDNIELARKVGIVVQTTQTLAHLRAVVAELLGHVEELTVVNTICEATSERQLAAAELAARADAMIVIGGRSSGNTRRLAEICSERCQNTHHIEDASELDASWFDGAELIGVTAGASTPADQIERTVRAISQVVGA